MPVRPRPLVLGHRGYRARFPENTLLSFRQALHAGADGIECDVQKSADGRYVVIHDADTERVGGVRLPVAETSSAELRRLDVGAGERIPFLEEMLGDLPSDAWIDLELKAESIRPADAGPISGILAAHRSSERLMISSFEPALLAPFRARGFTVGLLVGEEAARRGITALAAVVAALRPQFMNLPVETLAALGRRRASLLFRLFRRVGISLLFWTVNDTADARPLLPYAAFFVTDEVERLVAAGAGPGPGSGGP